MRGLRGDSRVSKSPITTGGYSIIKSLQIEVGILRRLMKNLVRGGMVEIISLGSDPVVVENS